MVAKYDSYSDREKESPLNIISVGRSDEYIWGVFAGLGGGGAVNFSMLFALDLALVLFDCVRFYSLVEKQIGLGVEHFLLAYRLHSTVRHVVPFSRQWVGQ